VGLSIVNGLVTLHGGNVTASSDGAGLGSTFEITLPLAEEVVAPPHDTAALAGDSAAGLRILIVEDNRDALELLQMMLTLYGFTVEVAHTGAEAIEVAARFEPDVLVCDIGLPEMNGYEVARTLRQQARHCPSRLIAVTGYGGAEFRNEAMNAGFDAHLVKPVNPHELLQELGRSYPLSNS
jgi:CheY-like chemotaxis protein